MSRDPFRPASSALGLGVSALHDFYSSLSSIVFGHPPFVRRPAHTLRLGRDILLVRILIPEQSRFDLGFRAPRPSDWI
jgi:hypothetical protein